jgi:phosphoserine phosphatase
MHGLEQQSAKVTLERVRDAITADQTNARFVLATDADGTLWDGDVGLALFEAVLAEDAIRDAAREGLAEEARSFGLDDQGSTHALATRLFAFYNDDKYPLDRAFAMMAWVFAGYTLAEMDAFAKRVLTAQRYDDRIRPNMRAMVEGARALGLEVWVVSASCVAAVNAGVASLGITHERVVAMTPKTIGNVIASGIEGPVVYGAGKVKALNAACGKARILAAFGDSGWDAEMLREAELPGLVSPAKGLLEIASTIPRAFILAPS